MNRHFRILLIAILTAVPFLCRAQYCEPSATYLTVVGDTLDDASVDQDAPLKGYFKANPRDVEGFHVRYEWKIWNIDAPDEILVHRFEEDFEYTFEQSGRFQVQLYATFSADGETFMWPEEGEEDPLNVVISSSKLEMPNAFSPNGDGYNDVYNAKPGFQSIVSFKATIFNRWGQRIYSWSNPDREQDGWDGNYNGRRVKDGVYYVVVAARGADGRKYNIRKDVNVLTGYDNGTTNSGGTEDE
ncbi:MAG: gliding motility-associated C-terminal domain-containing protein [Bacteroidaceae bacterium]|nr:gliding motility-associated C-terminal domain-containing protein [Bacteroidaceae bacterium]